MAPEIQWMKTLCQRNIGAITALYAPDAVLVATFAPAPLQGKTQIRNYFQEFIGGKPGLCGTVVSSLVQRPAANVYVVSGLYNFTWLEQGEPASQKARYTYVWRKSMGNTWQIITHHSSVVP